MSALSAGPLAAPGVESRLSVVRSAGMSHRKSSPVLDQALDEWARWMRASSRSEETIKLRHWHVRNALSGLRATRDPWSVTEDELVSWLAVQSWAPSTRRSYRSSLRMFYGWGRDRGLVAVSPAHALPPVLQPRSRPRPLPEAAYEVAARVAPAEMLIAILLAGNCGLRRGEIARARREDLQRDLVGWSLVVVGKGGHVRHVPVPDELADLIVARPAGWLFPSTRRPGHPVTAGCMGKWISAWLPGDWTTHSLRHRCATVALDQTRDIRAVQELLGHASVATTQLYTLVDDDRVRAAVAAASLPARRVA